MSKSKNDGGTTTELPAPTPEEIIAARKKVKMTQTQAGRVVHKTLRSWQRYEYGEREMDFAIFELFLLKTGQKELEVFQK